MFANPPDQKDVSEQIASIIEELDSMPITDRLDKLNKLNHIAATCGTFIRIVGITISDVNKASHFEEEEMDQLIETLLDVVNLLQPHILQLEELVRTVEGSDGIMMGQMERIPSFLS